MPENRAGHFLIYEGEFGSLCLETPLRWTIRDSRRDMISNSPQRDPLPLNRKPRLRSRQRRRQRQVAVPGLDARLPVAAQDVADEISRVRL